jgi:AraC family transcriptional regulator of adaptative response / methylphosphotriester-DNA alkyltransferase methyltransferase
MERERKQGRIGAEEIARGKNPDVRDDIPMTNEMWQAIVNNDASYNTIFYYAVRTTGIFCRPSCKSRLPVKTHVTIFKDAQQALASQFRPCKRCKPDGQRLPDEEWVGQTIDLIENHFSEPLTLAMLADKVHGSPFHLQRTFKRVMGVTPSAYIQQSRIAKAQQYLSDTHKSMTVIALEVGIPNAAHFATLFQKKTGLTPTEYRQALGQGRTAIEVKEGSDLNA